MKNFFLADEEIQRLIAEPKKVAGHSARSILRGMKPKPGRARRYCNFLMSSLGKTARIRGAYT